MTTYQELLHNGAPELDLGYEYQVTINTKYKELQVAINRRSKRSVLGTMFFGPRLDWITGVDMEYMNAADEAEMLKIVVEGCRRAKRNLLMETERRNVDALADKMTGRYRLK